MRTWHFSVDSPWDHESPRTEHPHSEKRPSVEHRTLGRTGRSVGVIGLGAWQLGADWGEVDEDDAPRRPGRGRRRRRHLHRHRRRLRRRTQRADHRPLPAGAPRCGADRGHQDGPPRRAGPRALQPGQLPRVERPLARQPRRRDRWTWSSCTARRSASTRPTRVFDALDTLVAEKRIAAYGVSVETCDRGADRHRALRSRHRADHPQRLPPQAAGPGAAGRRGGRRRHHRPRPAGQRPAVRPATTSTPRSAPTTTATTTGTARPSTSARPSRASTSTPGLEAVRRLRPAGSAGRHHRAVRAALDPRPARRQRRDPRRAQPGAGRRATPRPRICRRWASRRTRRSQRSTTTDRPQVPTAGEAGARTRRPSGSPESPESPEERLTRGRRARRPRALRSSGARCCPSPGTGPALSPQCSMMLTSGWNARSNPTSRRGPSRRAARRARMSWLEAPTHSSTSPGSTIRRPARPV